MANISISDIQTVAQSLNNNDLLLVSKETNGTYQSAKISKTNLLNSLVGLPDPANFIDIGTLLVGENASYTVQSPSWIHLDCNNFHPEIEFEIVFFVNDHPIGESSRKIIDNKLAENYSHCWFPVKPGDILKCQILTLNLIEYQIVSIHLHPCR